MKRDGRSLRYGHDALNRMTLKDVPSGTTTNVYFDRDAWGRQFYARIGSAAGNASPMVMTGSTG